MSGHLHPGIVAVVLALMACEGASQPAPITRLDNPADSIVSEFGDVTEGAWLGGSRWAVLAPGNDAAAIADFGTHQVRRVGGRGAAEIRNPSTLFRAGDTLYVGDWGLRRTTLWTLDGQAIGAIPASDVLRGALPRARDAAGRFYYELSPRPGPEGLGNRDSAAVVRTTPGSTRADTLARLAPVDLAEIVGDAGRRFERRVFSGSDRWGALADGSVWVARVNDNRVDWRDPDGAWRRGEPLPDRVLEVTRYDRELFFRKFPPELRNTAERLPFAAIKPPFEAALAGAAGEVWLEKSRAPVDSSRRYHLVDRQGRLRREIRVSGQGRTIAVGDTVLLVSAPGRDGAHLLRYAISPATATP